MIETTIPTRVFVLWFRKSRRDQWQPIANGETERAAGDAMYTTDIRHGAWLVCPAGKNPNNAVRIR